MPIKFTQFGIWHDAGHVYIRAPRAKTIAGVARWILDAVPPTDIGPAEIIRIELVDPPPPSKKIFVKRQRRP